MSAMRGVLAVLALMAGSLAAVPGSAQSQWLAFRDPKGVFSVEFPGTPTISTEDHKSDKGISTPSTSYGVETPYSAFFVTDTDFTALNSTASSGQIIDGGVAELRRTAASVLSDVITEVDGHAGREIAILDKDGNRIDDRVFYTGNHLYQILTVLTPAAGPAAKDDTRHFLVSFHFIQR